MRKVGIICAMQQESDALLTQFGRGGTERLDWETRWGVPLVAAVSGIGKVNAAVCAYKMINEMGVKEILSFGCAGGMTNEVKVGDVVIGTEYCYHDVWCGEPNMRGQVQGEPMFYPSGHERWRWLYDGAREGLIASGDAFCENEMMASAIVATLGRNPVAVDMESAAIAQVCYRYGIPFTSVRVISDIPLLGKSAASYKDFWQHKNDTLAEIMRNFMQYKGGDV